MPEMTSGRLIQDWYDRYVAPRKRPVSLSSTEPQDFSLGLPESSTPTPETPVVPPTTALTAPTEAPPFDAGMVQAPIPETSPDAPAGSTWSDKLTKGLQDPAKVGLLGMGLSMMATPPRPVKYGAGEIIGNAGLHGLKFFQQAVDDKRKADLMAQTAEEHRLTREDRRDANLAKAEYYKDTAETRRLNAESQAENRATMDLYRDTLRKNAELLSAPVPDEVLKAIGRPELKGITGNQFKEYGLGALNRPPGTAVLTNDKGDVRIVEKTPGTVLPGAGKSKTTPAGISGEGPGKTAAIALINKEMVSQYLTAARDEISKSAAPGSERMRQMVESLNTQDPTTGGPNEAKVREHLSSAQQKEFDFVKRKAQEYSKTMVPAVAVEKARAEWTKEHPAPKVDARYEEYRRVYEEIRNYPGWSNAEKNAKIKEMNDKARKMGLIK